MNAIEKAIWFIENHFAEPITLESIADACAVSPYHLTRIFSVATGHSVMRYVRQRRLTEAARVLAAGATRYSVRRSGCRLQLSRSVHSGFPGSLWIDTRGPPRSGSLTNIQLTEPTRMNISDVPLAQLQPPRFETYKTRLIAGIGGRYNAETCAAIPSQWQRFVPYLGTISAQPGRATYGVVCNSDNEGNIEYICGVEVSTFTGIPEDWSRLRIPEQCYAVFPHEGHVSAIRSTWLTIFSTWLPESGYHASGGPEFERYSEKFDPVAGTGGIEIWIPIQS
jgi:AraC family transcriptional regulator